MQKIYIDLGSNEGETIANFCAEHPDFHVYGFEPTPELYNKLVERFKPNPKICILNYAAFTEHGQATFYPGIDSSQSSTLMTGKKPMRTWRVDYNNGFPVQSIDFVEWLKKNTSPTDEVLIKMDIEGSEYDIIEALLRDRQLLERIKEMRVEWHWDRYPAISKERHERVRSELASQVALVNWH